MPALLTNYENENANPSFLQFWDVWYFWGFVGRLVAVFWVVLGSQMFEGLSTRITCKPIATSICNPETWPWLIMVLPVDMTILGYQPILRQGQINAKSCVNPKHVSTQSIVEIPWHSQNILRKIQKKQAAGDFPKGQQNDLFLWAKWSPNLIHRYTFRQRRAVILNPLVVSIDATSRPTTQSSKLQILLTGGQLGSLGNNMLIYVNVITTSSPHQITQLHLGIPGMHPQSCFLEMFFFQVMWYHHPTVLVTGCNYSIL